MERSDKARLVYLHKRLIIFWAFYPFSFFLFSKVNSNLKHPLDSFSIFIEVIERSAPKNPGAPAPLKFYSLWRCSLCARNKLYAYSTSIPCTFHTRARRRTRVRVKWARELGSLGSRRHLTRRMSGSSRYAGREAPPHDKPPPASRAGSSFNRVSFNRATPRRDIVPRLLGLVPL